MVNCISYQHLAMTNLIYLNSSPIPEHSVKGMTYKKINMHKDWRPGGNVRVQVRDCHVQ